MATAVKLKPQTWQNIRRQLDDHTGGRKTITLPKNSGSVLIRVLNESGADCPQFGILGFYRSLLDPNTNLEAFSRNIIIGGQTPSLASHSGGRFVICAEPIKNGSIGMAYAAGVCQVKVNVVDASHRLADVKEGDITRLESTKDGGCSILLREGGTGTKWAFVRFGAGGGSKRGEIIWVLLTNSGIYPMEGVVRTFLNGTFTNTSEVVQVYRYPTHTNNTMYGPGNTIAASREAGSTCVALHSIPRQFDVYP